MENILKTQTKKNIFRKVFPFFYTRKKKKEFIEICTTKINIYFAIRNKRINKIEIFIPLKIYLKKNTFFFFFTET